MIEAGTILTVLLVAAIGYVLAQVRNDGGPHFGRAPRPHDEWSAGLPSAPYAQRFNEQFTSAWYRFP